MRVLLKFSVEIDDCQYVALPKFSPGLLKELANIVSESVCAHDKLEGASVTTVGTFITQESGMARGTTQKE